MGPTPEAVPPVGLPRSSGGPVPLFVVRTSHCNSVGPLFSPFLLLRPQETPVTEGRRGRAPPVPQAPNVGPRGSAPRGVSSFFKGPRDPVLCSERTPATPSGPFFRPSGSSSDRRRAPPVTEGPTGTRPGPPSTSGTERGSHAQMWWHPWRFAVLHGALCPCPAVRTSPCNSVTPLFSPLRLLLRPQQGASDHGRAVREGAGHFQDLRDRT